MHENRMVGVLDAYYETGTEGVFWSFINNAKSGYNALNILANGDYLFVENGNGEIEWEGTVVFDETRNKKPHPNNPSLYQQQILGYWVHGVPYSVNPEQWAKWFFEGRSAVLIKGGLHNNEEL